MDPQEIMDKLNDCIIALGKGNIQYKTLALQKNKAEKEYRVSLAKKMLRLRAEGYPVSLINDLSRGDEEVSELRLKRDISNSSFYACKNSIDALKSEIEIYRSLLTWLREEYKN